jgi:hypothetical protein
MSHHGSRSIIPEATPVLGSLQQGHFKVDHDMSLKLRSCSASRRESWFDHRGSKIRTIRGNGFAVGESAKFLIFLNSTQNKKITTHTKPFSPFAVPWLFNCFEK